MNNFTDKWDKKTEKLITLPKKNFYGAIAAFVAGSLLLGYLVGGILHASAMMC